MQQPNTNASGYITITPVNSEHPASASMGQNLPYYWHSVIGDDLKNISTTAVKYHCLYFDKPKPSNAVWFVDGVKNYGGDLYNAGDIYTTAIGFINGDITSGNGGSFNSILTFYSRQSGNWFNKNTWSTDQTNKHTGAAATVLPGDQDIVIIGGTTARGNDSVWVTDATYNSVKDPAMAAQLTINGTYTANEKCPTLNLQNITGHVFTILYGHGKLCVAGGVLPSGDMSEFCKSETAIVEFDNSGADYTISSSVLVYPNLFIYGGSGKKQTLPDVDIMVRKKLRIGLNTFTGSDLVLNTAASSNLTVLGDVEFHGGSYLTFPSTANVKTVKIYGNINFGYLSNTTNNAIRTSGNGTVHSLIFYGSTITMAASNMLLWNSGNTNAVDLTFAGSTDVTVTDKTAGSNVPALYRIILDKDDYTNSITFLNNITINGPLNDANKSIQFRKGKLILDNASNNIALTAACTQDYPFKIPIYCNLTLKQGQITASGANTGIRLDGELTLMGNSIADFDDGTNAIYMEYSATGFSRLDVLGSSQLEIGQQFRRPIYLTSGTVRYFQEGTSTVTIFGRGANATRGLFEVVNDESVLSLNGTTASINLVTPTGSPTGDIYLDLPVSSTSILGGTFVMGNTSTAASKTFTINASVPVWNLTVDATTNTKTGKVLINPLQIKNNLTINGSSVFNTDGIDVSIGGNLSNNNTDNNTGLTTGGYQPKLSTQITIFNSATGNQSITGSGSNVTNFANLTIKNTATNGTVSIGSTTTIKVANELRIENGILDDNGGTITVLGNVYNASKHISGGTGSGKLLIQNTTTEQYIDGNGNGIFGNIDIDNPKDVLFQSDQTITGQLKFVNGKLNIVSYLLTLGENASFSGVTNNNFIKTNGAASDLGVRRMIKNNTVITNFLIPIGCLTKYTPAVYTSGSAVTGTAPYLQVRPVNQKHPSTTDAPHNTQLNYFWMLEAGGGFTTPTLTQVYTFFKTDAPDDITQYVPALFPLALNQWQRNGSISYTAPATTGTITFTYNVSYSGEYTAGFTDEFGTITEYMSDKSDQWIKTSTASPWISIPGSVRPVTTPVGCIMNITDNNTISIIGDAQSGQNAYRLYFNGTNAILDVNTTFAHNFLHVYGTGKLIIRGTPEQSFVFPAGDFSGFEAENTGTVEYSGAGTTFDHTRYNNVIFNGIDASSNPTNINIPAVDINCNGYLKISYGKLVNLYNRDITLQGNWIDEVADGFEEGTGRVTFYGSNPQKIILTPATATETFYDLEVANPATITPLTVTLTGNVSVKDNLFLTRGFFKSSTSSAFKLLNTDPLCVTGGSSSSFIDGPLTKVINTNFGNYFTFPIGNATRYGKLTVTNISGTADNQNWIATYFNKNPGADSYNPELFDAPIKFVSHNEYWKLSGVAGAKGKLTLRWDNLSGVPDDKTTLRIVKWNGSKWINLTNNLTVLEGAGTIQTTDDIDLSADGIYTLALTYIPGTITWTGAVDTRWSFAGNWAGGFLPFDGATVVIPQYTSLTGSKSWPTVDMNAYCSNLTMETGAWITIDVNKSLVTTSTFTYNSNSRLTIKAGASGSGSFIDNGTASIFDLSGGNSIAEIEMYITAWEYHMISAPLNNIPVSFLRVVGTTINPNIYYYAETATGESDWTKQGVYWVNPTTGNFNMAKGYLYAYVEDITQKFSGKISDLYTGNKSIPITRTDHTAYQPAGYRSDGWNLVGNPYPSGIDAALFIAANPSLDGNVYFWDDDGSRGTDYTSADYAILNSVGYIGGGNGTRPNGIIAPCQGFFVNLPSGTTGTVVFNNAMRKIDQSVFFKKSIDNKWNKTQRYLISVTGPKGHYNETLIAFTDEATDGFDWSQDGYKLKGNKELAFYSLMGKERLGIQTLQTLFWRDTILKTVPLGIDVANKGNYKIRTEGIIRINPGIYIYLHDKKSDLLVLMHNNNPYECVLDSGSNTNRFEVIFSGKLLTKYDLIPVNTDVRTWSTDHNIEVQIYASGNISGWLDVFDVSGRRITGIANLMQDRVVIPVKNPGIYIVRVVYNQKIKSFRVFVR